MRIPEKLTPDQEAKLREFRAAQRGSVAGRHQHRVEALGRAGGESEVFWERLFYVELPLWEGSFSQCLISVVS